MLNKKYEIDFPEEGTLNWKTIQFTNPKDSYLKDKKITGVLLHDGNFVVNGVFFTKEEFTVIDENPIATLFGLKI